MISNRLASAKTLAVGKVRWSKTISKNVLSVLQKMAPIQCSPAMHFDWVWSFNGTIIIFLQKATLSVLLQRGADATACSPSGETALSFAACQGQLDAVEQLLEYGADPDITNVVCNMVFQQLYWLSDTKGKNTSISRVLFSKEQLFHQHGHLLMSSHTNIVAMKLISSSN